MVRRALVGLLLALSWAAAVFASRAELPREIQREVAALESALSRGAGGFAEITALHGRVAAHRQHFKTLAEALEALSRRYPAAGRLALFVGSLHLQGDDWAAAEAASSRALAALPGKDLGGRAAAHAQRAGALLRLGRIPEASAEIDAACADGTQFAHRASQRAWLADLMLHATASGVPGITRELYRRRPAGPLDDESAAWIELRGAHALIEFDELAPAEAAFRAVLDTARAWSERSDRSDGSGAPALQAHALYGLTRTAFEDALRAPTERNRAVIAERAAAVLPFVEVEDTAEAVSFAHWTLARLSREPNVARQHLEACRGSGLEGERLATCWQGQARLEARLRDPRAVASAERALTLAAGNPLQEIFSLRELMRASWGTAAPATALARSGEVLAQIETLRVANAGEPTLRAQLFSTWVDDYLWLSGRLLQEADSATWLPRAFEVTEQMRARSLLDVLDVLDVLGPAAAARAPALVGLDEVRAALREDEALLSFQVAPDEDWSGDFAGGAWLVVVTRRQPPRGYRLPDRLALGDLAPTFVGLVQRRDGSEDAAAVAWYEKLFGPALAELPAGVQRLVLVPDDALHTFPLERLHAAGGAPLAERFVVSRVPSARLWVQWRRMAPRPVAAERALVFAAPELPPELGRPVLPGAAQEGRRVLRQLGGRGRLVTGAAATEAAFRGSELSRYGVLHLAAHAEIDPRDLERSAVWFVPGAGWDGPLAAGEIAELPAMCPLVVLSACDTAGGVLLRGEGPMSLARAFFLAGRGRGARAVVASLWPLKDADAQELFVALYRHLARGESVAEALVATQRELAAAGYPAEAWAGVVVIGDGEWVPFVGGVSGGPWGRWLMGAGFLLFVAVAVRGLRARLRLRK